MEKPSIQEALPPSTPEPSSTETDLDQDDLLASDLCELGRSARLVRSPVEISPSTPPVPRPRSRLPSL